MARPVWAFAQLMPVGHEVYAAAASAHGAAIAGEGVVGVGDRLQGVSRPPPPSG